MPSVAAQWPWFAKILMHVVRPFDAGRMLIEKLMSGLYMGDCARRLLLSFARHANLFNGAVPEMLTKADSFTTAGERVFILPVKTGAPVARLCSANEPAQPRYLCKKITVLS